MTKKTVAAALALATAVSWQCNSAAAYEPGDVLVQGLAQGFYSDASGSLGSGLNYDSGDVTINPALNLSYFMTKNIALQTVLAVPLAKVNLNNNNSTSSLTDQWVLPLSIIGQYHFFSDEVVSPFVGGGLTYAFFWEDQSHLPGGSHVELDDTYGGLVNFGLNFKFPDSRWTAVVDAKKWWLAPTNTRVGGNKNNNITVDPWFFGAGFGYNFSTPALF